MADILMTVAEVPSASDARHFGVLDRFGNIASVAYAEAAEARGHRVWWVEWMDLDLDLDGDSERHSEREAGETAEPSVRACRLFERSPREPSLPSLRPRPSPVSSPSLDEPHERAVGRWHRDVPLDRFDLIFIHKMEGFYDDLERFERMLSAFEAACPRVVNHPATIRANLDKHYLLDLAADGVPTVPTERFRDETARRRLRAGETVVIKPRFGQRACGVESIDDEAALDRWLVARGAAPDEAAPSETAADGTAPRRTARSESWLLQPYVPTIAEGERSLVYIRREFLHAVCKTPRPVEEGASFLCNAVVGGVITAYTPTPAERAAADAVLDVWEARVGPVAFSRIDLVPAPRGTADSETPLLMEAELINPGLYHHQTGGPRRTADRLARYFDELLDA